MATQETSLKTMLLKHFAPGDAGTGQMKTTSDLFAVLDEHAPGKFSSTELYDLLVGEGFQDKLVGDQIMWVVVPR